MANEPMSIVFGTPRKETWRDGKLVAVEPVIPAVEEAAFLKQADDYAAAKDWNGAYVAMRGAYHHATTPTEPESGAADERVRVLREALGSFMDRMNRFGAWDDGCFYYERRAAPELQESIRLARAALERTAL